VPQNSKAIRKRIKSVASTKKITRTMEMVATSKLQKTQGQVVSSRPYMEAMKGLMEKLSGSVESVGLLSPLFERRSPMKRVLVFVITANRGLCGGFNTNLVKKVREHLDALREEGLEPILWAAGKKGIAQLRFRGVEMAETRTDLSDMPTFADAEAIAAPMIDAFLTHEVDRVDVVYADFQSVARQPPTAQTLVPVGLSAEGAEDEEVEEKTSIESFIYEPSAAEILEELGPVFVMNTMYRMLLSSVASEQLARRVAMKNATDAAGEMETNLTRAYNKARQAAITQEIAEIVGGVEALK
jgi:F-type H+-transporting ATPase subunit gamma